MFGLGVPELIIILVIILVIFGPRKLPEIGKSLGGAIRELRKSSAPEPKEADKESNEVKAETKKTEEVS